MPSFSRSLEQALHRALALANERHHEYATLEHLLLALARTGAALVLDEFALILHLQDVYWSEDGRTSVDAVFIAIAATGMPAGTFSLLFGSGPELGIALVTDLDAGIESGEGVRTEDVLAEFRANLPRLTDVR